MRTTHLDGVDLNLVPVLVALLEERHVSRAAARLHLSQPAVSRALQRLRATFDNELLVRAADGYHLTPRAERIERELAAIVPRLDTLFADEQFDPAASAQLFRLAGTDFAVSTFGPTLFREMFRESPMSTLRFEAWHDGVFDDVERGAIDLVFFGVARPPRLRSQQLFEEHFVCVVSGDHPLADAGTMTLDDYLRCSHIVVNTEQGQQTAIDQRLAALGTPRQASLTVPYHSVAIATLPGTRLVATLPSRIVPPEPAEAGVRVLAPPEEIRSMHYSMSWHPRLDDDPAHRWLREKVQTIAATDPRSAAR